MGAFQQRRRETQANPQRFNLGGRRNLSGHRQPGPGVWNNRKPSPSGTLSVQYIGRPVLGPNHNLTYAVTTPFMYRFSRIQESGTLYCRVTLLKCREYTESHRR